MAFPWFVDEEVEVMVDVNFGGFDETSGCSTGAMVVMVLVCKYVGEVVVVVAELDSGCCCTVGKTNDIVVRVSVFVVVFVVELMLDVFIASIDEDIVNVGVVVCVDVPVVVA